MHKAPQAKTVAFTARLAGFENQKYTHRVHLLFPCARVPYGAGLRALGQQLSYGTHSLIKEALLPAFIAATGRYWLQ
jgi:hypothetical protein